MPSANDERDDNWGTDEPVERNDRPSQQANDRPVFLSDSKPVSGERPQRGGERRRYDERRPSSTYDERRPPSSHDERRRYDDRGDDRDARRYDERRPPYERRSGYDEPREFDRDARRYDERRPPYDRRSSYDEPREFDRRPDSRPSLRERVEERDFGRRRVDDDYRRSSDRFSSYDSNREDDKYSERRPYGSYEGSRRPRRLREDPSEPNETIGIFNLSYNLTLRDFEEFLADKLADFKGKFNTKLIINRETGSCKGYGFVTFDDIEDAIKAKSMLDGGEILGEQYRAAFSIKRGEYAGSREASHGERRTDGDLGHSDAKESENQ